MRCLEERQKSVNWNIALLNSNNKEKVRFALSKPMLVLEKVRNCICDVSSFMSLTSGALLKQFLCLVDSLPESNVPNLVMCHSASIETQFFALNVIGKLVRHVLLVLRKECSLPLNTLF